MKKINLFVASMLILCVIAQLSLQLGTDILQFSRADIEHGQWWRFLTANFIHLGWRHLFMNALALVVICLLFPNLLHVNYWFVVLLICSLAVTIGLWLFSPTVQWYVGLSGALHGLLLVLLLLDLMRYQSKLSLVLLVLIIGKLIWEIIFGPLPGSESTAGGPVVIDAHIYGAGGGMLIAVCFLILKIVKQEKKQKNIK